MKKKKGSSSLSSYHISFISVVNEMINVITFPCLWFYRYG